MKAVVNNKKKYSETGRYRKEVQSFFKQTGEMQNFYLVSSEDFGVKSDPCAWLRVFKHSRNNYVKEKNEITSHTEDVFLKTKQETTETVISKSRLPKNKIPHVKSKAPKTVLSNSEEISACSLCVCAFLRIQFSVGL